MRIIYRFWTEFTVNCKRTKNTHQNALLKECQAPPSLDIYFWSVYGGWGYIVGWWSQLNQKKKIRISSMLMSASCFTVCFWFYIKKYYLLKGANTFGAQPDRKGYNTSLSTWSPLKKKKCCLYTNLLHSLQTWCAQRKYWHPLWKEGSWLAFKKQD